MSKQQFFHQIVNKIGGTYIGAVNHRLEQHFGKTQNSII